MRLKIVLILLLVFSCAMPVNATNNSDVRMDIIYMGQNFSHDSFTGGNISKNIFLENYIPKIN